MTLLIGGAIAAVLGLLGLVFWGTEFLIILKGGLPIALLLTGILAVYVGFEDVQDKLSEERQKQDEKLERAREEIEQVKAKAERYKEEIDRLKKETDKTEKNSA
jgi:hypothetical protein